MSFSSLDVTNRHEPLRIGGHEDIVSYLTPNKHGLRSLYLPSFSCFFYRRLGLRLSNTRASNIPVHKSIKNARHIKRSHSAQRNAAELVKSQVYICLGIDSNFQNLLVDRNQYLKVKLNDVALDFLGRWTWMWTIRRAKKELDSSRTCCNWRDQRQSSIPINDKTKLRQSGMVAISNGNWQYIDLCLHMQTSSFCFLRKCQQPPRYQVLYFWTSGIRVIYHEADVLKGAMVRSYHESRTLLINWKKVGSPGLHSLLSQVAVHIVILNSYFKSRTIPVWQNWTIKPHIVELTVSFHFIVDSCSFSFCIKGCTKCYIRGEKVFDRMCFADYRRYLPTDHPLRRNAHTKENR